MTKEDPRTGAGIDGVCRYIETDSSGRAWITTKPTDAAGNPLPPVNAENIKRLLPKVWEHFRAQGEQRARAKHGAAADPEAAERVAAAERERIRSIFEHPYAVGRERLAEQLALTPDMTFERAGEILQVAPAERPSADGVIAPDPDTEARDAADRAIEAARRGGYIR